jgi:hypothetical protein
MLEHRWYLSEQAGHDVGTTAAARSYFNTVLPHAPLPLTTTAENPYQDQPEAEPRPIARPGATTPDH